MFNELLESVKEADTIMRGEAKQSRAFEHPEPQVRLIRSRTKLSQEKFAHLIGVKPSTLRNWEQGRRKPTGPAKALLRIVEADPEHEIRTLHIKKLNLRLSGYEADADVYAQAAGRKQQSRRSMKQSHAL